MLFITLQLGPTFIMSYLCLGKSYCYGTEGLKENTATVITASVNMDSERRDTRGDVDTKNKMDINC